MKNLKIFKLEFKKNRRGPWDYRVILWLYDQRDRLELEEIKELQEKAEKLVKLLYDEELLFSEGSVNLIVKNVFGKTVWGA